jgi:ABC-type sulfate transport system permease component
LKSRLFALALFVFVGTPCYELIEPRVCPWLTLAIYAEFDQDFDATLAMSAVLVLFSVVLLAALHAGLSWQRSESTRSPSLFGLSGSS